MCDAEQDDRCVSLNETEYWTAVDAAYRQLVKNSIKPYKINISKGVLASITIDLRVSKPFTCRSV